MAAIRPNLKSLREEINPIFYPRSIAVVGASANPTKTGNVVVQHLLDYQFPGGIYPINPEEGEILGLKAHVSVLEVPEEIDLAIVLVGRGVVEQSIADCVAKGVKGAIIHAAGFGESGPEGKAAQRHIVETARAGGLRLIGPNCVGVLCPETRVPWTRRGLLPRQAGSVAVVSQTGGGAGSFVNLASQRGISFSKVVSVGNQCDLTVIDFLEYLGTDDSTRVIFLYLEAVDDGGRFLRLSRQIAPEKPIIAYKIGRTDVGRRASTSHTGAIASPLEVYEAAFRQAGILMAGDVEEAIDHLIAFTRVVPRHGLPSGNRVGVVTGPGGPGIAAVDASLDYGLLVPDFSEPTKVAISEAVPSATRSNPVDMADVGLVAVMRTKDPYSVLAGIVDRDENVDSLIVVGPGEWDPQTFEISLKKIAAACKKPFVAAWPSSGDEVEASKIDLDQRGIPHFLTPERAARALASLVRYTSLTSKLKKGASLPPPGFDVRAIKALIGQARDRGQATLTEHESKAVLSLCGAQVTREELASSATEAALAAVRLGFPVALKIASPFITHKTDAGGVVLDIRDEKSVIKAYEDILTRVGKFGSDIPFDGVLVQEMVSGGVELIVGATRDDAFGPVILFGLGGISVEILRDVSLGIAPLTQEDVAEMLREVKAFPVLEGARGKTPVSLSLITDLIMRVAALMCAVEDIQELDLNPVLADSRSAVVADARIAIR